MTKVPQTVSDAMRNHLLIILISTLNSTSVPFSNPTDVEFCNLNKRQQQKKKKIPKNIYMKITQTYKRN